MQLPILSEKLNEEQITFLKAFSKSCRHSIISMLKNSQSGHPGGSLSSIDYLSLIYSFIVSQTGESVIVSHGHISPAVYSILAELKYIPKAEVIKNFRKFGSIYEGHITRHVKGVEFGTGPLGVGVSIGSAIALANKMKDTDKKVFTLMGDGEAQEGQVYEMMNFASANKLNNLILFIDYNRVQLTDSLDNVIPMNFKDSFEAAGWKVIEVDGHDFSDMWKGLKKAYEKTDKPIMLLGKTIMGKGAGFMEEDGQNMKPTWHGKAANPEESDEILKDLVLSDKERAMIAEFIYGITWTPKKPHFEKRLAKTKIKIGNPIVYNSDELTDCRTAYGKALLDLAKLNPQILAISADLRGSVMTKFVASDLPNQHIECGIAEQHMVSLAGGLSLSGYTPFCSTFGAFLSSRAKDQARVNDINQCNVKMVATHCGLSVGEDGPTHQAIDDMTSFLGMYNMMIIEPADPNQTDRMVRYIASHYGNFYMRMGRHKFPVITKEDGNIFFDHDYEYEYGKTDTIREGSDVTIAATGATITEAIKAINILKNKKISIELVACSSIKKFDENILKSVKKTGRLITVEDHNSISGLGSQLIKYLTEQNVCPKVKCLGTTSYQLSGKVDQLYNNVGIGASNIAKECESI